MDPHEETARQFAAIVSRAVVFIRRSDGARYQARGVDRNRRRKGRELLLVLHCIMGHSSDVARVDARELANEWT